MKAPFNLFNKKEKTISENTVASRIVVCSLVREFDVIASGDAAVYERFYSNTNKLNLSTTDELRSVVAQEYDVVHLLCNLSPDGSLVDRSGATLTGTELITHACESNTKVLFVASDNPSDAYLKGFRATGRTINLVMTLNRKGNHFVSFLASLLGGMAVGKTMPSAWAGAASTPLMQKREVMPECIFFAGRPHSILRP
jgi:hypothetical protein